MSAAIESGALGLAEWHGSPAFASFGPASQTYDQRGATNGRGDAMGYGRGFSARDSRLPGPTGGRGGQQRQGRGSAAVLSQPPGAPGGQKKHKQAPNARQASGSTNAQPSKKAKRAPKHLRKGAEMTKPRLSSSQPRTWCLSRPPDLQQHQMQIFSSSVPAWQQICAILSLDASRSTFVKLYLVSGRPMQMIEPVMSLSSDVVMACV